MKCHVLFYSTDILSLSGTPERGGGSCHLPSTCGGGNSALDVGGGQEGQKVPSNQQQKSTIQVSVQYLEFQVCKHK